ncbi:UDP-glucosyltransferase B1 [Lachnellula occidentalis]|uniref:UDP-glucosyltransferase B1 n=1 Tax=Lachnellula occidentalis TaxID=215460 RepID=A0A8H8S283_9HELO|nr:UDP-glucosyltransferase B1 [Lachnellula occidentalis]
MQKPLILMGATPIYGHTMPLRAIARGLIERGFDITFVTGSHFRESIEAIGARFHPHSGYADISEATVNTRFPGRVALAGEELGAYDNEHIFVRAMSSQYESIQLALKDLKEREPEWKVVLMVENGCLGIIPSILGAPGIQPDAHITIGVLPLQLSSIDTAPFGTCIPPDSSPSGRERNAILNQKNRNDSQELHNIFLSLLASTGARTTDHLYTDAAVVLPDRYIEMCIPEIEYPRSDLPSTVHFAGGLPHGSRDPAQSFPDFWHELIANKDVKKSGNGKGKKVVAVSQGTFSNSPTQLLLPTINALAKHDDVIVVAALGARNATLPPSVSVPGNVRVADFIPFDELLPYCDVFVTNGGYGAVQHAIANGVPMVVAGNTEEKPENACRVAWAGIGVNLKTGTPSEEALEEAVVTILGDGSFKQKIEGMKRKMEECDALGTIAEAVLELGGGNNE